MVESLVENDTAHHDDTALRAHWPCDRDEEATATFSTSSFVSSSASTQGHHHISESSLPSSSGCKQPVSGKGRSAVEHGAAKAKDDAPLLTRILYSCAAWLGTMPKIPLEKGYSQMDWMRLTQTHPDLSGLGGKPPREDITMEEVRKHHTKEDAWMVFNGMVFNITPYLRFHPGGADILVKVAGKDGSSLFMKYHPWVNIGALMRKCLVGRLAVDPLQAQVAAEIKQARLLREQQQHLPAQVQALQLGEEALPAQAR